MPKSIDHHASPPTQPFAAFMRDDQRGAERQLDRNPRILVVEDDFLVATEIEVALQSAGFAVAGVAASADEAIALAQSTAPDLAIIDIRLNGVRDGIDAALALFRDHAIPCVFATAHADEIVRARAAPASPLGWLQKPYTMPLLIEIVRRALAQRRGAGTGG
jgi:two-component system, response regulator PdtaR